MWQVFTMSRVCYVTNKKLQNVCKTLLGQKNNEYVSRSTSKNYYALYGFYF